MGLRYASYLARCPDQPCPNTSRFQARARTGFRFMHNVATEEDFKAPCLVAGGPKPREKCSGFSLSFFVTVDKARETYRKLAERIDVASRYGGHIGEIALTTSDGLMDEPDEPLGHFELHPEEDVEFANRVTAYYAA